MSPSRTPINGDYILSHHIRSRIADTLRLNNVSYFLGGKNTDKGLLVYITPDFRRIVTLSPVSPLTFLPAWRQVR